LSWPASLLPRHCRSLQAAPAAQILDAELIELGARFEPLVDRYYAVRAIWARAMTRSHSEQDLKFGSREERGYHDSPEMTAAWEETCERNGLHDASIGFRRCTKK